MRKIFALAVAGGLLFAAPASADPEHSNNNTSKKLREAVTVSGILEHNGRSRTSRRSPGQPALGHAGLRRVGAVRRRPGRGGRPEGQHAAVRLRARPAGRLHAAGVERRVGRAGPRLRAGHRGRAVREATSARCTRPRRAISPRPVWAADIDLDPATAAGNTSGCQAADYAGMPQGAIVLLQYSEACSLGTKFFGAQQFGAGAIVFFDVGRAGSGSTWPGPRSRPWRRTFDTAVALANGVEKGATGLTARLKVDWRPGTYPTSNVIAETRDGDPDNVIVVGAHLDSVGVGPGINDNGSGSATILEIAEQMRKVKPRNKIRFIWFGAEEHGLLGSEAYVDEPAAGGARQDRGDAELRHGRLAQLRALRLRRRPVGLRAARGRGAGRHRRRSSGCSWTTSRARGSRRSRRRSTAAPTTGRSSSPASRRAGCSPAPRSIKTAEQAAIYGGTAGRAVRPVLPPRLRRPGQPQQRRARPDERRRRARDDHARAGQAAVRVGDGLERWRRGGAGARWRALARARGSTRTMS